MDNRVLVDTSIWIDFFRYGEGHVGSVLDRLLAEDLVATTGLIRAELLQGCRSRKRYRDLSLMLDAVHPLAEPLDIWNRVGRLGFDLRRKGHNGVGISDLLIGVVALHHGIHLLTLDQDFDAISQVRPLALLG